MKDIKFFILETVDKKKFIGKDFTHLFKIFDDNISANKITLNIEGEDMWIKEFKQVQTGIQCLYLTKNKKEAGTDRLKNYSYQVNRIFMPDDSDFKKKYSEKNPTCTTLYNIGDNEKFLWISNIKRNTVYIKYTTYDEIN